MGTYLNPGNDEFYNAVKKSKIYVDKTELLKFTNSVLCGEQKDICVSRPRRFGKSMTANMLVAYYSKGCESKELFDGLKVAEEQGYEEHLNKYNVIHINMIDFLSRAESMDGLIDYMQRRLLWDIKKEYSDVDCFDWNDLVDVLETIYSEKKQSFVIIIDEWDCIFRKYPDNVEEQKKYLDFLRFFIKGKSYVALAYMTGILPIKKYGEHSALNMFDEYDMACKEKYSEYFGFLDEEVDQLYDIYKKITKNPKILRSELKEWYDGYRAAAGDYLYNPRSVVCALRDNQLANYWTSSGTYDSIFNYIKGNIADVRNDLVLMVAGEHVPAKMQQYAATANALHTKDQIYSAMVVYGLLTYENGKVFIPNKELMDKFDELLLSNQQLGYVYRLARESQRMLQATIHGDTDTMEEILEYVHDTEVPIYSYNSEVELSAIVNLVYLSARDEYRVEREDKAGKGFVDFIFYPKRNNIPGIILELKIDHTPQKAIEQIKEKNYQLRFQGKIGEIPVYEGSILAVGISYDKKTKKHSCEVEML